MDKLEYPEWNNHIKNPNFKLNSADSAKTSRRM